MKKLIILGLSLTLAASATMMLLTLGVLAAARAVKAQGTLVGYESSRAGNWEIYVRDMARNLEHNLTRNSAYDGQAVWSPGGEHVAFVSDRDGPFNVYVMAANGADVREVGADSGINVRRMRWTSNGEALTFYLNQNTGVSGFHVDIQSGVIEEIDQSSLLGSLDVGDIFDPRPRTQHPDGRRVFLAYRDSTWGLYLTDTEGKNERLLLTDEQYIGSRLSFSPDGKQLLITSSRDGNPEIYTLVLGCLDLVGGCEASLRRQTYNPFWDGNPVWLP